MITLCYSSLPPTLSTRMAEDTAAEVHILRGGGWGVNNTFSVVT